LLSMDAKKNKWAFPAFWIVIISTLALSILFYRKFFGESYRFLIYSGVDAATLMGPINLAYIGVIVIVISFQRIISKGASENTKQLMISLLLISGGMTMVILSATRSALLVIVTICMINLAIEYFRDPNTKKLIGVVFIIFFVVLLGFIIMARIGSDIVGRYNLLMEQILVSDPSAGGGRLLLYQDTLKQIIANPLFGSGLEVKYSGAYPHNHILEAFMATGIIGGLCFCFLCWETLKRSFLIIQDKKEYGWVASLFIVYFMHGLFSSSIINPPLWYSMLAVYAVPFIESASPKGD
jgi:O-antigen ligase